MLLTGVTGFLGAGRLRAAAGRLPRDARRAARALADRGRRAAIGSSTCSASRRSTRLRERVGEDGLWSMLDERVDVIDGDFGRGQPEMPAGIDIAMHSAATVSFDPPIDEGFMTNLLGAMNLYGGVIAGGSTPVARARLDRVRRRRAEGRDPGRTARAPRRLQARARARHGCPQATWRPRAASPRC